MKKELVLLGSMIAMSAALSSCCCGKKEPQNGVVPAPKVVNYKDNATSYVVPTVSEQPQVYTQPVVQQAPSRGGCSQVQPMPRSPYSAVPEMAEPDIVGMHENYVNTDTSAYGHYYGPVRHRGRCIRGRNYYHYGRTNIYYDPQRDRFLPGARLINVRVR